MHMPNAMAVVILAGGLATRLRPITEKIPKSLVEVAGKPFLDHQIALLRRYGLTDLVLCVGHLGEMIRDRYGDGSAWDVRLHYSFDGPKLLGTGGALKRALPLLGEGFLVLYGDSYLPVDYQAVVNAFRTANQPALMTVFANADAWDKSNVWWEDGRIKLYSKRAKLPQMQHIDYGLMVLTAPIFDPYDAEQPFDLAEPLEDLSRRGRLAGYEVRQRFYEIGSPAGLAELNELLRK
ncbi:MAG: nucleotidyltransferase family protein [Verrucomicrobia bacterium]|nr:nucleotidyltransferase family protein [Verrucomicrobiota bacterium]